MEGSHPKEPHIPEPPSLLSFHDLFFLAWDLQTFSPPWAPVVTGGQQAGQAAFCWPVVKAREVVAD